MLNTKNIINSFETKATAKLPITQKQMDYILKKFKGDMIKALNILWTQSGNVLTRQNIGNSIIMNSIDFGIGSQMQDVLDKWRDDLLVPLYGDVVGTSGALTSSILSDTIDDLTRFSITAPEVAGNIELGSLNLVRDLSRSQMESLRGTLQWGLENNIRSDKMRALMRENISLTKRETNATLNAYSKAYEKELKIGLKRGMTKKAATKRALRGAEKARHRKFLKLRNVRTERIYRTELSRLKHTSDIESLNQALNTGKIQQATKTWSRTGFNDNWQSSIDNDGQTVGINDFFNSGDKYPNEINERCILEYGIKYKKGVN